MLILDRLRKEKTLIFFPFLFSLVLYWNPARAESPVRIAWEDLLGLEYETGESNERIQEIKNRVVRIPGFMVPLGDGGEFISEFLLVPDPMMCIHVPAPPPNQVIHVIMKQGKKVRQIWPDPILLTGVLKVENTTSEYAVASYSMKGLEAELFEGEYVPYGEDPTADY